MNRSWLCVVIAAALCTEFTQANAALKINFLIEHVDIPNSSSPTIWRTYPLLNEFRDHTLRSTHGYSGANGSPAATTYLQHAYSSFQALMDEMTSPWSLSVKGASQTEFSTFTLSPDFSSLSSASFASSYPTYPSVNQVVHESQPVFAWVAPTAPVNKIEAEIDMNQPPYSISYSPQSMNPSTRAWQTSNSLTNASYTFYLWLFQNGGSISMTSVQTSGPDLGLVTASYSYRFQGLTPFTVALPEPTAGLGCLGMALIAIRRRARA